MKQKSTLSEPTKTKRKFFIGIFTILLTFIFFVVVMRNDIYQQELKNAEKRLALIASQLNEQTDSIYAKYRSLFISLSEIEAIKTKDTIKLNKLFKKLNQRFNEFENIAVADEKGFFFGSGQPFNIQSPPNLSKLSFFQRAKKGERFIIMAPHIGPISNEKVTGVVVRLENNDQGFGGVFGASIKLSYFVNRWVEHATKNNIMLVCYRGTEDIVFSNGINKSTLKDFFSSPISQNIYQVGKKKYLTLTIPIEKLELNFLLIFELEFPFFKNFFSNPLMTAIFALFISSISFLIFLYRKDIVWLKVLKNKETLLSNTQKLTKVGGWEWDVETESMHWTEEVYRIHGFGLNEVILNSTEHIEKSLKCYNPEDRPAVQAAFQRCIKEGVPYELELPFTSTNESKKWVLTSAEPELKNGRITKIVGNIMDITERKQAEESLYKHEQEFRTLVENAPDIIFRFDQKYRHTYVNSAVEKATGIPSHEFIGKDHRELGMPEEHITLFQKHIRKVFESGQTDEFQFSFPTPNGEEYYESRYVPEFALDETVKNVVGITRNITDRIKAEEQIKASLKEKETLLQEIHHRVKNNMTVISSLLKLQANSMEDDRLKDALVVSQNRIQSISAIHEVLYQSENLSSIDMNTYLSKLAGAVAQNYTIGSKINVQVESENVLIAAKQASPVGLIINELITNSFKYAFPDNQAGEIKIILQKNEDQIELTYMDNGVGIPEDFDLKNSSSLGLKLVRTLVENQLDGSIDMESNSGTKFIIKFNIET